MHQIVINLTLLFFTSLIFLMLLTAVVNLFIRVPYVPSKKRVVERILRLARLKKGEKVYDLGCGDARFLIEAEKSAKVQATGYEAAPIPFILAYIRKWLNGAHARILMQNFFNANLKDADVIFCYLGPETMAQLAKKFKKECRKGTRIFSHTFHMSGMKPYKTWVRNPKTKLPTIYLYKI